MPPNVVGGGAAVAGTGGGFVVPRFNTNQKAMIGPAPSSLWYVRSIGDVEATVTIEEVHSDEIMITDHPVERGSEISDHAYKRPAEVQLRVAWSNSDEDSDPDDANHIQAIYQQLLYMQQSFRLITVLTGKRVYENMLVQRLSVTTDKTSQDALFVTVSCREIFLAQVTIGIVTNDPTLQKIPESTQPTASGGQKLPQPAPNFKTSLVPPYIAPTVEPLP